MVDSNQLSKEYDDYLRLWLYYGVNCAMAYNSVLRHQIDMIYACDNNGDVRHCLWLKLQFGER